MRVNRRQFLQATGTIATCSLVSPSAFGQDFENAGVRPVEFPAGIRIPTVDEYTELIGSLAGPSNPYKDEVEKGRKLLTDIPTGPTPYQVAYRFHQWRNGKVGSSPDEVASFKFYAHEWPVRGNPIIMGFFDATGLRTPVGDTTYWCAAFVSWCIQRTIAGEAASLSNAEREKIWRYKDGAASAAYRDWGQKTKEPVQGDIAVFQRGGYTGHIGFVHDFEPKKKRIWVLGGNQGAQGEWNGGEVNIAKFRYDEVEDEDKKRRKQLRFHSFRTDPRLHKNT